MGASGHRAGRQRLDEGLAALRHRGLRAPWMPYVWGRVGAIEVGHIDVYIHIVHISYLYLYLFIVCIHVYLSMSHICMYYEKASLPRRLGTIYLLSDVARYVVGIVGDYARVIRG